MDSQQAGLALLKLVGLVFAVAGIAAQFYAQDWIKKRLDSPALGEACTAEGCLICRDITVSATSCRHSACTEARALAFAITPAPYHLGNSFTAPACRIYTVICP